ncbi:hypothetical protein IQ251_08575 [Saccharopolyspora sp. HNM0983]|uniref:Uncharacterized protein n=1 Tax=Saccharopolyspora montiporae TaxID=2781240 RepID=A0A929BAL2_9PSEU|nr:hypothetical protein [Saccharopolyspora sp. HNM0983]MBE9374501.1 hypothetical protein [Saccharopolyspora sp. HNM0983]
MAGDEVRIPAESAAVAGNLPAACAAHGRPAVRSADFAVQSRAQVQGSRVLNANVLGMAARAGERARQVQVTRVRGWPLCRSCARRRSALLGLALLLLGGGLVSIAVALLIRVSTGEQSAVLGVPLLGGFAAVLAAVLPFSWGSLPRISRARTSADGRFVLVADPHPAFAAQVRS